MTKEVDGSLGIDAAQERAVLLALLEEAAREFRALADQIVDLNNQPLELPAPSSALARFDGGVS